MSDDLENEMREMHEAGMASRPDPDRRAFQGSAREYIEQRRLRSGSKSRVSARFDADLVHRYKEMAGESGSYQALMNQALREWLERKELRELIREELREALRDERPESHAG